MAARRRTTTAYNTYGSVAYAPAYDGGIRWDDPELGIDWGVENPVLSAKDAVLPLWKDAITDF